MPRTPRVSTSSTAPQDSVSSLVPSTSLPTTEAHPQHNRAPLRRLWPGSVRSELALPARAEPSTAIISAATVPVETGREEPAETQDAELIVAVFRTMVLLFALLLPRIFPVPSTYSNQIWLAAVTGAYNIVTAIACIFPSRFGLRRPFIVIMDGLLITAWIRFSSQWELFPFYYIVVVVAAMWFRVLGGVIAAACSGFFFFFFYWNAIANDPTLEHGPILPIPLAINTALLFLVGALVGYIAEAQEGERARRLEGQLLIANYQREIDLATQLQPLLISSQWSGADAGLEPGAGTAPPLANKKFNANLEIGAAMQSARALGGGDYFDVIPLEAGRTALCIADVSGKSARAQARLPLLKYSLRALAPLYPTAESLLNRLNEILAPDLQPEYFIAFCYIVLDSEHQTLTWCNAGHIAPLLITPSTESKARKDITQADPKLTELAACGPPLGMFPEMSYTARTLPWQPGDQLLLFTDGLTDAFSYAASEDGEAQVRQLALRLTSGFAVPHEAASPATPTAHQVAQDLVDLATTILDETTPASRHIQALIASLARRRPLLPRAAPPLRDDITVILARSKMGPPQPARTPETLIMTRPATLPAAP